MQLTSNYGLKKPEGTDIVNIEDLNENADIIDTQFKALSTNKLDKVTGKQLSTNDYTTAEKNKLADIAANANNYTHPSGDGNLHVPATGTTNSGKVLKASATAGSIVWGSLVKSDVGLGNVVDYGIATQAEAEAGTATNKYMTAQRTQQAIDKNLTPLQEQVTQHLAQTSKIATFTKTVAQTIPHSAEHQVTFATQNGMNDKLKINANGYIEVLVAGVYDVNFSALFSGGTGTKTAIVVNKSQDVSTSKVSVCSKVKLGVGSIIYIAAGNISGNAVDVAVSVLTNVQIMYLGE